MGAAYGPGLLPCITAVQTSPSPDPQLSSDAPDRPLRDRPVDALSDELLGIAALNESEQIELLCQFALLNFIPLFHEQVGGVVYRFTNKRGQIHVSPIPDKINRRVIADIRRHSASLDGKLLDWLETPLLLPGTATRRHQTIALPGYPLEGWSLGSLRSERNTLNWLHTEAQENHASNAGSAGFRARGYSATLATRHGYDTVIEAYGKLLACWDYCDRFKFIGHVLR